MAQDRLERALEGMRHEAVDPATLDAARARVWASVSNGTVAGCAEFTRDFSAYVSGDLPTSRRVLIEDHVSRCPACRNAMADLRGQRRVIAMPQRSKSSWRRWTGLATAAALLLSVVYLGRDSIDAWMAPGGPRATVVSASGGLYAVGGGALGAGAAIGERDVVRTSPGAYAVLRLADGSTVNVNERTELYVTAAWSGQAIHLQRGDVIVEAAKQRRGHLRVLTRDSIAAVKGTVFGVSSGLGGSVVSVVEGAVEVNQPGRATVLRPGQQAASNPALATSVAEAVSWSPDADEYLQLLASFAKIGEQVGALSTPLRNSSALLPYLPASAFVYGAVPNLGSNIAQALAAAEQQATENAVFRAWWESETGLELRRIVDQVRGTSSLLGEEVVFSVAKVGANDEAPLVMAKVQPGQAAALTSALDGFFAAAGESSRPYAISGDLVIVSDSPSHLAWAVGQLGQGASSTFAGAIADRYRRGAGWLIAVDAEPVIAMAANDDAPPIELAGMAGVKHLFLEQRSPAGLEEHEVTVTFGGARTGMASWLADGGSGGAAEYLPADSLVAGYVSMRQPGQLFQELTAILTKEHASFEGELADAEKDLGAGFIANLTAAMGAEAAFALQGLSVTGPTWVIAALANNPAVIDSSIQKVVDTVNAKLEAAQQTRRAVLTQETVNGRVWSSLTAGGVPFGATWTYDGGYLVVASDRGTAERAIATRNSGSSLVWSAAFQGQLPASSSLHPSAFAWLNTKGALGLFSAVSPSPAVSKLLAERDPVLVVFDGKQDQIHAASRANLSGVIVDAMLLESLTRSFTGTNAPPMR